MSEETEYTHTVDDEKFESYDEAVEYCYQSEIIYYNKAMEYLSENDWTLTESIQLAHDLGCDLSNLNSETLASIHHQNELIQSIEEIQLEPTSVGFFNKEIIKGHKNVNI